MQYMQILLADTLISEMHNIALKSYFYDTSVNCLAGESFYNVKANPGLNDQHKRTFWVETGKVKLKLFCGLKEWASARFEYDPNFIKWNESTLRSDLTARKVLQSETPGEFCKEVRLMN